MEKYINAISNSNLLGLENKIRRFGKGKALTEWTESELERFCRMYHIKTAEEKSLDAEFRAQMAETMASRGITSTAVKINAFNAGVDYSTGYLKDTCGSVSEAITDNF